MSFQLCDLYGIALAALGMLATLSCGLTIDGFGPISDNAGADGGCVIFCLSNSCVETAGNGVNMSKPISPSHLFPLCPFLYSA